MSIYSALKGEELYKKIVDVLITFLRRKEEEIGEEKYIFLKDLLHCIPILEITEKFKIYEKFPEFFFLFHQNPFNQYRIIKKKVYAKDSCVVIVLDREHVIFDCFNLSQPISINPKTLVDDYCKTKINRESFISNDINLLQFLFWDSIDFILEKIDRYQKKLNLENRHLVEILFNEIIDEKGEHVHFLRNLLLKRKKIKVIFNDKKFNELKERIDNYLTEIFPKSFVKIIINAIIDDSINEIYKLLLIISYIKQFDPELTNFIEAFNYINSKTSMINSLQIIEEISSLSSDINSLSVFSDKLLKSLLVLYKEDKNALIIIKQNFDFPRIIEQLEEKISLLEKESTTKKYIFFPKYSKLDSSLFRKIPDIWLSNEFLKLFIQICLIFYFDRDGEFKSRNRKKAAIYLAEIFKAFDCFKNNVFYIINDSNSQFWIKLSFIKNYIKLIFYLDYFEYKIFPDLSADSNNELKWKYVFKKYYIPLNFSLEEYIEDTLQFIPDIGGELLSDLVDNYAPFLEKKVINTIERINDLFKLYLINNYKKWVGNVQNPSTPLNVVNVFKRLLIPNIGKDNFFSLILFIDCCHLGIWEFLKQKILNDFPSLEISTKIGYSILPTSTSFARKALFSGQYPRDQVRPNELNDFIRLLGRSYHSIPRSILNNLFITHCENMFDFQQNIQSIKNPINQFQVSIFNFSDEISHTFSQSFLKSLTSSLYNSKIRPLIELVIKTKPKFVIFFATDHGNSRCTEDYDWQNSAFNRYWEKKNKDNFIKRNPRLYISSILPEVLNCKNKNILHINKEKAIDWGLKTNHYFLANNFTNFQNTPPNYFNLPNFGHGGITMSEFIIPFALITKNANIENNFNWNLLVSTKIEKNDTEIKFYIEITNTSNKKIVFNKGHLITSFLHHKFLLYEEKRNIISNKEENNTIIINDIIFPKKLLGKKAYFYFTFYQDEKLERSNNFYF